MRGTCLQGKGCLNSVGQSCELEICIVTDRLLLHIFCQNISKGISELMLYCRWLIPGWQNIMLLWQAFLTWAFWRNSCQATIAEEKTKVHLISGRESCVLQTPYAGSRVFQLSRDRLPLYYSTSAFCLTKGSWISTSRWNSADQCFSRDANSSWKNG